MAKSKSSSKKSTPKSAPKKVPTAPVRKAAVKAPPNGKSAPATNGKHAKSSPIMEKPSKKNALRDSILKRKSATKPIAFGLDEALAIAKTVKSKTASPFPPKAGSKLAVKAAAGVEKAKPQHVKA